MIEAEMVMNNHSNNRNDEWYTPQVFVDAARDVMGAIDLDPASSAQVNERIGASTFYSVEDDAFTHEWHGRVWMNPPYSRIIKDFVNKLVDSYEDGTVTEAIVVTNNGTDTRWFHRMAQVSSAICLPQGRIAFLNSEGVEVANNNKGQVFTYIGPNVESFARVFDRFGKVYIA
ncbi:MAG: DNA N-6-adenine-methyltransferase [Bacteroidales bacterium]